MLCQLSYAPTAVAAEDCTRGLAEAVTPGALAAASTLAVMKAGRQSFLLGLLFLFLAAAFGGVALAALLDGTGGRQLVTALAAGVIAFWLGGLALRALRRS